jgi:CheY-like chemotaxis protein
MPMGSQLQAARVLIVDDHVDSADSLATLLRLWGHDAHVAYNGRDALAKASRFVPDVIFLDLAMPAMDGLAVAAEIVALPELKNVRLIAVTGMTDLGYRLRAQQAGIGEYLLKPVDLDVLRKLLTQRVLDRLGSMEVRKRRHPSWCEVIAG